MFLPITCNWPAGSHIYWITSTIFIFVQNSILRHPRVMSKINPTFYSDMQRVFFSERSKSDSDRYIKKLKNCEDPYIKAPTTSEEVTLSLNYELREMKKMKRIFQYRKIKENAYGIASTKLRKTILKIHS